MTTKPTERLSDRSGYAWGKIRKRILRRDCGVCQVCGRAGNEVDHIKPLAQGGTDDDDQLQTLCASCHADKTAREQGYRVKRAVGVDGIPEGWK